ncbi:MAG: MFS transporter [Planctomycetales bacterium]
MSEEHSPPVTQAPTNRRWIMFSLASGASWFLYLHRYTFGVIRPELEKEFGFSNIELDSIFALFNLTYAIGQIPGGIVCDFFGPHIFLAVIMVTWSLVLPFVGLTSSLKGLAAARLTFGFAQAGCYPSLAKVTRVWFPSRSRTIVQGLIASFFGRGGGAMGPIVMSSFLMGICALSWRMSLVLMAVAGVAFALVFLAKFRNNPENDPKVNAAELALIREGEVESGDAPPILSISKAVRNPSMLVFIVQQFMNAGADMIYVLHMGSYFRNHHGIEDDIKFGVLLSLPLWGGACGGIAGGFINDGLIRLTGSRRWSRAAVGFTGKFLACFFLYAAAMSSDPLDAAWLLFATKFFSDWTQPTVWGASTDMGGRYSGTVFSIINCSGSIAGFIVPVAGGFLLDHYATKTVVDGIELTVTHFEPVFLMVGVMYLLSAVCWVFINSENSLDCEDPLADQTPSDKAATK